MADTKISALPELTGPASGDFIPIVDTTAGATKKIDYELVTSGVINVKAYGAEGDGSTDDRDAIQAAIDAGGGHVLIPDSATNYIIGSAITVSENVHLEIARGATVECTANVNAFELKPGARIDGGGTIYLSNASSTSACMFLDGSTDTFTRHDQPTGAGNLYLKNAGQGKGQGIYCYVDGNASTAQRVEWCIFDGLVISDAEDGIKLECNEDSGDQSSYVNGNMFSNIAMEKITYGIRTLLTGTGSPSITGNTYSNIQFQTDASTTSAILEAGAQNVYTGIKIYDFVNATSVECTGYYNIFVGAGFVPDEVDQGVYNAVFSQTMPTGIAQLSNATISAIDASTMEGNIVYDISREALTVATSKGWRIMSGAWTVVDRTATGNVSIGHSGMMLTNNGASAQITMSLQVPVPGEEHIFRRDSSYNVLINPINGTWFEGKADGAYKRLDSDDAFLHIRCYRDNTWHVVAAYGDITDE